MIMLFIGKFVFTEFVFTQQIHIMISDIIV